MTKGQVVNICLFRIQVEGEGSDLHFNVFHKRVMIGKEYEVRVSSVDLSTGKVSPLSRAVTVGEKMQ